MPRKGEVFNLKRNERVNEVISDLRISQKEFGRAIHLSAKTVSGMVNNRQKVTEQTARLIVEKFPGVCRYEWLLGIDDFKTEEERSMWLLTELADKSLNHSSAIQCLLRLNGWKMTSIPDKEGMGMNYVLENSKEGKMFVLDTIDCIALDRDIDGYIKHRLDCMYDDSKLRSSWDATKTMKDESR